MVVKVSNIPNRVKNPSKEHPYVAGAVDIYDDTLGKPQSQVNQESIENIATETQRAQNKESLLQSEINALEGSNFVTVDTYSDLPEEGSVDTIYRVSNWDGSANDGEGAVDATVYSQYAWDADNSVYKLLAVRTQIGEVFDISLWNAVGGVLATYDDLADALGVNGANVPAGIRKGGMSIKFVLSSDNKYVRFNYLLEDATTNSKFTNVSNWQGVDDELTPGSNDIAKSGETYKLWKSIAYHFQLTGAGDTGVEQWFDVIPNHSYTLLISKKWDVSLVTSTSYIFILQEWDSQGTANRFYTATKNNYNANLKLNYTVTMSQSRASVFIRANSGETVDFYLIDNTSESVLTTKDVKELSDEYYFDLKKRVGIDSVVVNGVSNTWIKADGSHNGNGNFRTTTAKNEGYSKVIVHSQCGDNNLTDGMVPVAFYSGTPSASTFMQSASATPLYNRNSPTWYEMDVPEGAQYICACSRHNYIEVEMYLLEHSTFDKLVQDFMNVGLVKTEQSLTDAEKLQSRKNIGIDDEFLNEKSTIDGVAIYGMESGYIDANGNKRSYGTYRRSYIPNKGYSKILALCGCDANISTLGITFVSFYSGTPGADTFMSEESTTPVYATTAWTWYEVNVPATAKYIGVTTRNDSRYPLKALLFNTDNFLKDINERMGAAEEELGTSSTQYNLIKEDIGMIGIDNKSAGMSFTSSTFTESKFPFAKREVTGKRVGIKPAVYLNTPYHMQGAAIYENILFITCEGGYGNVTFVDMRNGKVIQFTPELIKTNNEHHNNQAFFGTEKYDEDDFFPLLYISGAADSIGCIEVYRITGDYGNWTMEVVQTIGLPLSNANFDITSADISLNGSNMIAMGYKSSTYSSTVTENTMRIADLGTLPSLSAGNTTITTVVDAWDLPDNLPYYQGNIILNNMLYVGYGRRMAVIDLVNKTEETLQLYNFSMEQEAYFLYNNELYVAGVAGEATYGVKVPLVYYIEFIKE